jgi:hypothetical protein
MNQGVQINPRAQSGSVTPMDRFRTAVHRRAVRERMLSREIHRAIRDIAASLGLPANCSRQRLAAELKRAEKKATTPKYMWKMTMSEASKVPIVRHWLLLQGLESLINQIDRFEHPDPTRKVKELLYIRAEARRRVKESALDRPCPDGVTHGSPSAIPCGLPRPDSIS